MRSGDRRSVSEAGFGHEALLYRRIDEFAARVSAFVLEGLDAGEPVLLAVSGEHADAVRHELGADMAERVRFAAAADFGRNPAHLVPLWQDWVAHNRGGGRFRGVSEPVRAGQNAARDRACRVHEHLTNAAFDAGPGWTLLCPYDIEQLAPPMIETIARSHPRLSGIPLPPGAASFDPLGALDPLTAFAEPLPDLGPPLFETTFGLTDLPQLRAGIREYAAELGLVGDRVADFVLVADELACNSVQRGGGDGRLALWAAEKYAVCEVSDKGLIIDPLAGRRHPDLLGRGPGAGLWSANRICELLLIRSAPTEGTAVRAYLEVAEGHEAA